MSALAKIRSQVAYLQRLRRSLGTGTAFNLRLRMAASNVGLPVKRVVELRPVSLDRPMQLRLGTTDLDIYEQVLVKQEYAAFNSLSPRLIVDCGANVGYSSAYFLSRFPTARVIAVEPFPENAEQCRHNLRSYGDRVEVHQAAVWGADTDLVLDHVYAGHEWAVKVRPAQSGETPSVQGLSVSSLTMDEIDILKVDIEGSEIELFGDIAETWLPRVRNIVIELHGRECRDAFFTRMSGYSYDLDEIGELTLCRNITPLPRRKKFSPVAFF